MITKASIIEAVAALKFVLSALQASTGGEVGSAGAELTYAIGSLQQTAATAIGAAALSPNLSKCFDLAVAAGASLQSMTNVFLVAGSVMARGKPAKQVIAACRAYAAIAMSEIIAATTFTSRDDVDTARAQIGTVFDVVESNAGNTLLTGLYQSLVTLHAAVTADLTIRSYPLPKIVAYGFPKTFSALSLAQRLYGDATRAEELALENAAFNPAFMPQAGRALSA